MRELEDIKASRNVQYMSSNIWLFRAARHSQNTPLSKDCAIRTERRSDSLISPHVLLALHYTR